eukprot:GILJ01014080.1.p1 GENE.GILJ01014080.1~~GILJ01014080.1.p1  ORF type:complete len:358 (+),score=52.45 GILJ01014080.1:158-1231(+)
MQSQARDIASMNNATSLRSITASVKSGWNFVMEKWRQSQWSEIAGAVFYAFVFRQSLLIALFCADFSIFHTRLGYFFPYTIDSLKEAPYDHGFFYKVLANSTLISLFALQHSIMARPSIQHLLLSYMPRWVERVLYLTSSTVLVKMMVTNWHPMLTVLWRADGKTRLVLDSAYWLGVAMLAVTHFAIYRTDAFGFRSSLTGREFPHVFEQLPLAFKIVRQPVLSCFLVVLWCGSYMTVGRLLFASMMSAYLYVGMTFREKDLESRYGQSYLEYKQQVPLLLPFQNDFLNMFKPPADRVHPQHAQRAAEPAETELPERLVGPVAEEKMSEAFEKLSHVRKRMETERAAGVSASPRMVG